MNLSYHTDYWPSPALKAAFTRFLVQVFGLDLSLWDKMGFWDHRYRPFSYFDGDTLVSNVCVYSMNMTVNGRPCQVAQISAVGTLPEYRRKGLSFELTKEATDWARANHDFFYLFADKEAFSFYDKCGFRLVDEYKTRIAVTGGVAIPGAVRLDVTNADDLARIYRLAFEREPVSNLLGVSNPKLFMFWCLYYLRDNIYYIPDLDVLVVCKRENALLTISDIVGARVPAFSDFYPYIRNANDETVELLFMADRLNPGSCELIRVDGNGTHIMGDFPLEGTPFIFPLTSHA